MGSKRNKSDNLQVSKITEKVETIDFDSWFYKKVRDGIFRDFQKNEVQVYFQESGLRRIETEATFEDKLRSF